MANTTNTWKLAIEGMHCDACVRRVRNALTSVDGVGVKQVQVGSASVEVDDAKVAPDIVTQALEDIGFTAKVVRE